MNLQKKNQHIAHEKLDKCYGLEKKFCFFVVLCYLHTRRRTRCKNKHYAHHSHLIYRRHEQHEPIFLYRWGTEWSKESLINKTGKKGILWKYCSFCWLVCWLLRVFFFFVIIKKWCVFSILKFFFVNETFYTEALCKGVYFRITTATTEVIANLDGRTFAEGRFSGWFDWFR